MKRACIIITVLVCAHCSPGNPDKSYTARYPGARGPVIGMTIPDMELDGFQQGDIKKYKLADYHGKWLVIFFYPADFTFVCPTELKELADHYVDFRSKGAELLSVSTDSAFVHRDWHSMNKFVNKVRYPMLSDRNGALARHFGVYDQDVGQARRASFIITPEGKVLCFEVHHETIGRSILELLRKLDAAIAVSKSPGVMCPAEWKPGKELIKVK